MGKKARNLDGSKKKTALQELKRVRKIGTRAVTSKKKKPGHEDDDDEEVFENSFIWQLKEAIGIGKEGLDFCTYCHVEVPINLKCLQRHYASSGHINNQTIHHHLPMFCKYGMGWMPGKKRFFCEEHGVELEAKSKILFQHVEEHGEITEKVIGGGEDDFGNDSLVVHLFKYKWWKVDLNSTNARLNIQLFTYKRLVCPFTMREDSPSNSFIGSLKNDIFSINDLALITKATSYLEIEGEYVDRSETIQGSRMNAFGMRWAMGDTGWYKHKNTDVYKVAEELINFVSERLELKYPGVFQHLRKILDIEGFGDGSASIGSSPFTTFCVTRDYNCRPHVDQDDYDLGFIIWLQEDAVLEDEEVSLFGMPDVRVAFTPKHGDVFCSRGSSLYHCTRVLKKKNQLGLAFFQKASLFRQLKRLLDVSMDGSIEHHIPKKGKTPAKTIIERRSDFEVKKRIYKGELENGKVSLGDF